MQIIGANKAPRMEEVEVQVGSTDGLPQGDPGLWALHLPGEVLRSPVPQPLSPHHLSSDALSLGATLS